MFCFEFNGSRFKVSVSCKLVNGGAVHESEVHGQSEMRGWIWASYAGHVTAEEPTTISFLILICWKKASYVLAKCEFRPTVTTAVFVESVYILF